ncbi:DUF4396 domain-containing protein [Aquibacillus kalidii]|uniref:DUF4396 domain-containing protein n=1 Tax=Aquibacillus kalidii TaxID=2762597 RepID=UPI001646C6A7|nr:DUF4396 domain-containing protein [Aquibacillus kalidii]
MLTIVSWLTLGIGILSSIVIALDVRKHPQMMKVMNVVWPINGWFLGPIAIWTYFRWGRLKAKDNTKQSNLGLKEKVFVSTSHCSSGCSMGDAIGVPIIALTGWTVFQSTLLAHYVLEFVLAFIFGIVFQLLALYPMNKEKGIKHSLKASLKADSLSLIAFEIGMFGWMAIVHLTFNNPPIPSEPTYWLMMQIAMILGFITSYPANMILVKKGIKSTM